MIKFSELYRKNKEAFRQTMSAMWCSEPANESQKVYAKKIKGLLDECFAPENALPLVQSMESYKHVNVAIDKANELIGGRWKKSYLPFQHQYECWKALSEEIIEDGIQKKKSIVVTTGTGSGKTECFMLPLIHDLQKNYKGNQIEAIFLYPLNALMEDQKNRLQEYLNGTDLKFAVYNGNLPEKEDENNCELINEEKRRFPSIIPTRASMRSTPPNILLTNPTMLEYMLLRTNDMPLFTSGSLKWIVIDETHTFTGAGAAELAMLLRRVLKAFKVTPEQVRFATSSATIGNGAEEDLKLKEFIAGISSQSFSQIEIIKGDRTLGDYANSTVREYAERLMKKEYLPLNELIGGEDKSIEDRLEVLDSLCEKGLKAKLHLFYRVLNNGLRVKLTEHKDGFFNIYTESPLDTKDKTPYLELRRCKKCGEYLAIAEQDEKTGIYSVPEIIDNDMFDFSSGSFMDNNTVLFGLTKKKDFEEESGNVPVKVEEDKILPYNWVEDGEWHIVKNQQCKCPHCGQSFNEKEEEVEDSDNLSSFRLSTTLVSQILAPSILPLLKSTDGNKPHNGQQYITFVDSRQAAARCTLKQNLEQERMWVQSRIYHELCKRTTEYIKAEDTLKKIKELEVRQDFLEQQGDNRDWAEYGKNASILKGLKENVKNVPCNYMTWTDIYNHLSGPGEMEILERLCVQFINRSQNSNEIDDYGRPNGGTKVKYLYMVMMEQLGKRPLLASSPETMGLFTSYYPELDKITELPVAVINFNTQVEKDNGLELKDWKNLLKIFLDHSVRSNESFFVRDDIHNIDIFDCQRFESTKQPRRQVHKPSLESSNGRYSTIVVLLCSLLPGDGKMSSKVKEYHQYLSNVIKELWKQLLDLQLLQLAYHKNKAGNWVQELDKNTKEPIYRMNVERLCFKLYENPVLCKVAKSKNEHPKYRPIETTFKGYTPYQIGNEPAKVMAKPKKWEVYPYYHGSDTKLVAKQDILNWAHRNRQILCENHIWGENGCFSNRLNAIHAYPNIFIQAEHTAQIDKIVAKQSQEMFKEKNLNILACSTTMEMGIDLGDLELVMMNSLPPHPANYKQRVGRSGRGQGMISSAGITLCTSDSLALRTMYNPYEEIINRKVAVPFVDLQSKQVIQRHLNSYLLRESLTFNIGTDTRSSLKQECIEFFTNYYFKEDDHEQGRKDYTKIYVSANKLIYPDKKLGDEGVRYTIFKNYLDKVSKEDVRFLLKDTCFENFEQDCIDETKKNIEDCYDILKERANDIGEEYIKAKASYIGDKEFEETQNGKRLRKMFSCLLSQNLLQFLSTNRFTPNANMPVNIIEFDINGNNLKNGWSSSVTSNPSYQLQEALSQYAPGNAVVYSNSVRYVRGILYTGIFRPDYSFKQVYTDGEHTVLNTPLPNAIPWPVNNREGLELIEPYAFIPDVNERVNRSYEKNRYTHVSAQLIGADDWMHDITSKHLFSIRSNRECVNAKILYYNEGIRNGYAVCTGCGKTMLETGPYNPIKDKSSKSKYDHYHISQTFNGQPVKCKGSNNPKKWRHNVILGGLFQTDYAEMIVRKSSQTNEIIDEKNVLNTLGIVFCTVLAKMLGIERRDIDFVVMQNKHLCIFDTNPGGAGYSNRLANIQMMNDVIDEADKFLDSVTSVDRLLDKFTMKYSNKLDIDEAKKWIKEEINLREQIPQNIMNAYASLSPRVANFTDIETDLKNAENVTLFVSSDWNQWRYQSSDVDELELTWKNRIRKVRKLSDKINRRVFVIGDSHHVETPVKLMMKSMEDWCRCYAWHGQLADGVYPVAYINDRLYITDVKEQLNPCGSWASDCLYCINIPGVDLKGDCIDLTINTALPSSKFVLSMDKNTRIKSCELADVIAKNKECDGLIQKFMEYCNQSNCGLEIEYMDEHLKSIVGMVTTIQFIKYFVKKFNKPVESLKFVMEQYVDYGQYNGLESNLSNDRTRDQKLKDLISQWTQVYDRTHIDSKYKKSLPHWRCLSFRCGEHVLEFYPNGGIINEWRLPYNSKPDDVTIETELDLVRRKEVMYDVIVK